LNMPGEVDAITKVYDLILWIITKPQGTQK
jgi:hypothetical protein